MPEGVINSPNVKLWHVLRTIFFEPYRRPFLGRRWRFPVLCVFCVFFPDWLTSVASIRNRNFS